MPKRGELWPHSNPGRRNHKIVLLRETQVQTTAGVETRWLPDSPPYWVWGRITPGKGEDLAFEGQLTSKTPIEIEIRYNAQFVQGAQVKAPSGAQYVIRSINNDGEMNLVMILTCEGLGLND